MAREEPDRLGPDLAETLAEEERLYGVEDQNGRFVPMEEYARRLSNVKLRQAHTQGVEHLMEEHGFDLVQISEHVHRPDSCTPFEGKVYGLQGRSSEWPRLPRRTPFHVGCRHVQTPFVDTFRSDDELAELREKSAAGEPIHVYSAPQLDQVDERRRARGRRSRRRRRREKEDAVAVARGEKEPKAALREERAEDARFVEVGAKYLERLRITADGRRVPVDMAEVESVFATYLRATAKGGVLDELDLRGVEGVARYVQQLPHNGYVWERIKAGGVDGLALMVHEVHELDLYSRAGIDPWDLEAREPRYREFHGKATIREHSFALAVAGQKRYDTTIGALMLSDPNAAPPEATEEQQRLERERSFEAAARYGEVARPTPDQLEEARRFWRDVRSGTVSLEGVDLDAISLPRAED